MTRRLAHGRPRTMTLLALALAACVPHVPPVPTPPTHGGPTGLVPDSAYGGVVRSKRVADKRAPTTLIATDAFTCSVPETTWNSTKIGDAVRCVWMYSR